MADAPVPAPRTPLDRAALERVLARAAELQAQSVDSTETLSDDEIMDLGKEVGLSGQLLRQALAEERAGRGKTPTRSRFLASAYVTAERTVRGTAGDVLGVLDSWLQNEEWLQIKRQFTDRIIWEPRRDLAGGVRRLLNVGGRGYALSRANDVSATVVQIDQTRVLVRLDADLSAHRRAVTQKMVGLGVFGAMATGAAIVLHFALAVALGPVILLSGLGYWGARELQSHAVSRAQLTLEQLLDRLERGEQSTPPSLLKVIATAAGVTPRR